MTAEEAILTLLARRGLGKTICPSEAARLMQAEDWRPLMPVVREAAQRLADEGRVMVFQKGVPVDLSNTTGAVRIGAPTSVGG